MRQKKKEMKQQRMKTMTDMIRKTQGKRHSRWVSELLAADCTKNVAPPKMEGHNAAVVQLAARDEEEG